MKNPTTTEAADQRAKWFTASDYFTIVAREDYEPPEQFWPTTPEAMVASLKQSLQDAIWLVADSETAPPDGPEPTVGITIAIHGLNDPRTQVRAMELLTRLCRGLEVVGTEKGVRRAIAAGKAPASLAQR